MSTIAFMHFSELSVWLYSVILVGGRLLPVFMMLPFLNASTVPDLFRYPLVLFMAASLWPISGITLHEITLWMFLGLLAKEVLLGVIIGLFLCFPFWVLHAAGSYIDNQRGATLSSSINPQTGIDSSELANFFNMFTVVLILQAGGLLTLLEVMLSSYRLSPPGSVTLPNVMLILRFASEMMMQAIRLAAPLVVVFLVTEVLLGLLSRYTPQLNAFSMAITVKSFVGFALLLLYLSPVLPGEIIKLERFYARYLL